MGPVSIGVEVQRNTDGDTPSNAIRAAIIVLNGIRNQRTNGPVNAHLISWPSKAQNIRNLENIW